MFFWCSSHSFKKGSHRIPCCIELHKSYSILTLTALLWSDGTWIASPLQGLRKGSSTPPQACSVLSGEAKTSTWDFLHAKQKLFWWTAQTLPPMPFKNISLLSGDSEWWELDPTLSEYCEIWPKAVSSRSTPIYPLKCKTNTKVTVTFKTNQSCRNQHCSRSRNWIGLWWRQLMFCLFLKEGSYGWF